MQKTEVSCFMPECILLWSGETIENTIEGNLERHDSGASCYSFFYIDFTAVHK